VKNHCLYILFTLLLFACGGEEIAQERIVEEPKKEKDYTKIRKVKDSKQVAAALQRIQAKYSADFKDKYANLSIGERYKRGDSRPAKLIAEMLGEKYSDQKEILYIALTPDYEGETYPVNEPFLRKALVQNIFSSDEQNEREAIDLIGKLMFPGAAEALIKRLRSGESNYEEGIIYALSYDPNNLAGLDFLKDKLLYSYINNSYLAKVLKALYRYRNLGNKETRNYVNDLCIQLYYENLIPDSDYNDLEIDYEYGNPALDLLTQIFLYGDERAVPIAMRFEQYAEVSEMAKDCIFKNRKWVPRKEVLRALKSYEQYPIGLQRVEKLYAEEKDIRLARMLIENFEKLYFEDFHYDELWTVDFDELIHVFLRMVGPEKAKTMVKEYLKEKSLIQTFYTRITLKELSLDDLLSYFEEFDLISTTPSTELTQLKGKRTLTVHELLTCTGNYEDMMYKSCADYYDIIASFVQISAGKLKEMSYSFEEVIMDNVEMIRCSIVYKGIFYEKYLLDDEFWYFDEVADLLNTMLADNKSDFQFYSLFDVPTSLFFGTQEQHHAIKRKFGAH
jgi:hypothetical protein